MLVLQVLNRVAISARFNRLIANSNPVHVVAIYVGRTRESKLLHVTIGLSENM